MINFEWTITIGQVLGTSTVLAVFLLIHFTNFRKQKHKILYLEREIEQLRQSIRRITVLLKIDTSMEGDD